MGSDRAPIPGVGVAILDEGRVLLVQKRSGPFAGLWGVPGGKIELGETRVEAAHREVAEETGLEIELGDPIWIGEAIGPGEEPAWHFTLVDFVARPIGGRLEPGDDAAAARWVTPDEMRRLDLIPLMEALIEPLEDMIENLPPPRPARTVQPNPSSHRSNP